MQAAGGRALSVLVGACGRHLPVLLPLPVVLAIRPLLTAAAAQECASKAPISALPTSPRGLCLLVLGGKSACLSS